MTTSTTPPSASTTNPIVRIRRLVADGRHNAFTDLIRWRDQFYLTYRRSSGHGQTDGDIVLLRSPDGVDWREIPCALRQSANFYEGHMVPLGDQLCMFSGAYRRGGTLDKASMRQYVSLSRDGVDWSEPVEVGEPRWRFWRPIRIGGALYTTAYNCNYAMLQPDGRVPRAAWTVKLLRSDDAVRWDEVSIISTDEGGNETQLFAEPDGRLRALIRCEDAPHHLLEKVSAPPYTHWSEPIDCGQSIQGQNVLRTDGRLFLCGRYRPGDMRLGTIFADRSGIRTRIWLNQHGYWLPYAELPSGADCSYPGLASIGEGRMLVSYYSQHAYLDDPAFEDSEYASDIYLAEVRTDAPANWGRIVRLGRDRLREMEGG